MVRLPLFLVISSWQMTQDDWQEVAKVFKLHTINASLLLMWAETAYVEMESVPEYQKHWCKVRLSSCLPLLMHKAPKRLTKWQGTQTGILVRLLSVDFTSYLHLPFCSYRFLRALHESFTWVFSGAPNVNFRKNICSEDDLRSRIFGTFVVKFLACLPLLGFSDI